eukprot:m.13316 g.13316  ORF g.13316 m.13316 type:complete len:503 (-) comp8376_c0_seq2:47-1555(-)
MLAEIAAVLAVIYLVYRLVRFRKFLLDCAGTLGAVSQHWLFGHALEVDNGLGYTKYMDRCVAEFPKVFYTWYAGLACQVTVCHPETVKIVCNKAGEKAFFYKFVKNWSETGLVTAHGKIWSRMRKLLTPAFHFKILSSYCDFYSKCSYVLMKKWSDRSGEVFNVQEDLEKMTMDALLHCCFSFESNCQIKPHPYGGAISGMCFIVMQRIYNPFTHADFIHYLTPNGLRELRLAKQAKDFCFEIIRKRREALEKDDTSGHTHMDFVDILLMARDDDGVALTDAEIVDQVNTFLAAGHETTAHTLMVFLYAMAAHPEHQQKCQEEIDALMDASNEQLPTLATVNKMDYTVMCLKESQRMFPAVPTVARTAPKGGLVLDGHHVPEGAWLEIGIWALHRNPHLWKSPEKFDPLRFNAENSRNRDPYQFIPFSAGPRNCIGQNFAMLELKIAVCQLLRHFSFERTKECPDPRWMPSFSLGSLNGVNLKVTKRRNIPEVAGSTSPRAL